jgi:maleate cis-trans isomerase
MPAHYSVGLLYPGYAAEDDYPLLERLLGDGVALHVEHTSVGEDAHRVDALLDLGGPERLADGADALMGRQPVDAVVWACTSGSFVFGWDGAHAQAEAVGRRLGLPASSTSLAFARAARGLQLDTVALAATYPDDVTTAFVDFLDAGGIDVVHRSSQGIVTAAEVGTLTREAVLQIATDHDHPDAQAVLMPDTALHTIAWIDDLEAALGKPVLTANQVTAWEGLRIAGWSGARPGLGELFRRPVEVGA